MQSIFEYQRNAYLCAPVQKTIFEMRQDIHPDNYRLVVFKDVSNDYSFMCHSCVETEETVEWEDGNTYPLVKLEISYKSHPFFTGKMKFVDTAGRVDKFRKRYAKFDKK